MADILVLHGAESGPEMFDSVMGRLVVTAKRAGFAHYGGEETVLRQGPYNEIQIICGGKGSLSRGRSSFTLDAPSICIIPLSETARIHNVPGLKKIFFQCNITYGGADILLNDIPRVLPCTGDTVMLWERASYAVKNGDVFAAKALLFDTLSSIRAVLEDVASKKRETYERFAPFFEYVRTTPLSDIAMADLGERFGMHKNYFSQEFKRQFGMPAKAFALAEKIRAAKALLLETEDDIPSIARALGFFDRFHFSRMFKKHTGTAPAGFRDAFRR